MPKLTRHQQYCKKTHDEFATAHRIADLGEKIQEVLEKLEDYYRCNPDIEELQTAIKKVSEARESLKKLLLNTQSLTWYPEDR